MQELKTKLPEEVFHKLLNAEIDSLHQIIKPSRNALCQQTSLEPHVVENIQKQAAEILIRHRFRTADNMPPWRRIKTDCLAIDSITNGGLPAVGLTEIYGCSGVGKTQLALTLSLMVQLPEAQGGLGLNKGVVYICTEDAFPSKRLNELAQIWSEKYSEYSISFEDNIYIDHISDFEQMRRLLEIRIEGLLSTKNIGLLVIDSIAGIFRSENENVVYSNRSKEFITIATTLNKLAKKYNFAILIINQVTENINTMETDPCLGLAWSNLVTTRINLTRNHQSQMREFEIVFAPDLACKSCSFSISHCGLVGY